MAKAKEKTKSVKDIIAETKKEHGQGSVTTDDSEFDTGFAKISTGILALDEKIGGGLPKGRIVDVYGPEGGGKTGIAYSVIAQAQKEGVCAFFDLEDAYDPNMARLNGVNTSELLVFHIEAMEDCLQKVEDLALSGEVAVIVIDSFAGLVPRAELEGDIGDSHVGLQGRLASQALRLLTKKMPTVGSETIILVVNQLRNNIGAYGNESKHTVTGGRAVKFYASTRIEVRRIGQLKRGDEIIGHTVRCKTEKCKLYRPFQVAEFDVIYGEGISNGGTLLDQAFAAGLVVKSGHWYADAATGESLGNGRVAAAQALSDDPELFDQYLVALRAEDVTDDTVTEP